MSPPGQIADGVYFHQRKELFTTSDNNELVGTQIKVTAQVISELRSYGSKAPKSKLDRAKSSRAVMAALNFGRSQPEGGPQKKKTSKDKKPHRE